MNQVNKHLEELEAAAGTLRAAAKNLEEISQAFKVVGNDKIANDLGFYQITMKLQAEIVEKASFGIAEGVSYLLLNQEDK